MFTYPAVDVADICLPPLFNATAALQADKHVLYEKLHGHECAQMVAAANTAKKQHHIDQRIRFGQNARQPKKSWLRNNTT